MSLHVQLYTLLSCCFLTTLVAKDVSDISISRMADGVLAAEQAASAIKEWTLDWQPDSEEIRASLMSIDPAFDAKKLLEDVLVDDGHDDESEDGDVWTNRDVNGRCGCCGSMKMVAMYAPSSTRRQPLFNGLANTICERFAVNINRSGLDPMPLLLRRRSVQEAAYLFQTRFQFKRSINSNFSAETIPDRYGKSHDALLESTMWDTPTVRVAASLRGLSTFRRTKEDVQTMILPNGKTILRINMEAGPLQFIVPSADSPAGVQTSQPLSEKNSFQQQTPAQVTLVEKVFAEMSLVLYPRQGLRLHSFQISNPAEVKTNLETTLQQATRIPFRASGFPVFNSGNEAAVAQQLRRIIRQTLRSS